MIRDRKLLAALLVALVGVAALIVRAEVRVRAGATWLVPVEGYDPRDLLSGHFLRFRYKWPEQAELARLCEPKQGDLRECAVCLSPDGAAGRMSPLARFVPWSDRTECDAFMDAGAVSGPQRFYIPEDRGSELERALRDRQAAVLLSILPSGEANIKDLYLDGKPWREVVTQH